MAANYVRHVTATPQTEALPGQVANSAGGFSFAVDSFTRLERFLILGCEGGTYYSTEAKLARENVTSLFECAKLDLNRTLKLIVDVSVQGRAPKNDPAIFALALLAADPNTSARALECVSAVCRIGTHLFQFVEIVNQLRGWGRGLRRAIGDWYLSKSPNEVAYQVTKYQQRGGWSHRDVLRLAHPSSTDHAMRGVLQYVTQREKWATETQYVVPLLHAVEEARHADTKRLVQLIEQNGLAREHIPTEKLNEPSVWEALLQKMPVTALIRNLNKLTDVGVAKPLSSGTAMIVSKLTNAELLTKGRVHPYNLLVAGKTYASGRGLLGDKTWTPVPEIVSALEDAFYLSFGAIEPTNKRFLFGLDVSGSMSSAMIASGQKNKYGQPIPGPISACVAGACLVMVGVRTEPRSYAFGFADSFRDLKITAKDSLEAASRKAQMSNFGQTNCAVPMEHALREKLEVDAFVVVTDNETYAGRQHPTQALNEYRRKMGINAKLIVIGMTSTGFSIADPKDSGQLDVVGFDSSAPSVIADFVR